LALPEESRKTTHATLPAGNDRQRGCFHSDNGPTGPLCGYAAEFSMPVLGS